MKKSIIFTCALLSGMVCVSLPLQAGGLLKVSSSANTNQKSINLNTADASALLHAVKGLGQKRADAIVAYRIAHGSFKSIADLAHVRGFGARFVKSNLQKLQSVFVV